MEATEAIYGIAAAGVTSLQCGLSFDDEAPDPAASHDKWIRVSVIDLPPTSSTHGAAGNRLVAQRGRVVVQAFALRSLGDGVGVSKQLAQDARDLYHGSTVGADAITFSAATVNRIPGAVGDPWVQHNASIPFSYQERI